MITRESKEKLELTETRNSLFMNAIFVELKSKDGWIWATIPPNVKVAELSALTLGKNHVQPATNKTSYLRSIK